MLALCRSLIALGRAIVPVAMREDWTQEWRAELWHAAERMDDGRSSARDRLSLVFRCAGAVVHALWLRKEDWSFAVLMQDLKYALRALRCRPGFAAVAIATLAVGIGANTTVFSVVQGVLLKPLPYRDPDRLVQIWETNPPRNWTHETVAPANLLDWKTRSRSFEDIAYYIGSDTRAAWAWDLTLTGSGDPERVRAMAVSSNFFSVLDAPAAFGRTFHVHESLAGRTTVVVLSEPFWRRRFGADPTMVGRTIDLDGRAHQVAGIMPRAFHIPGSPADLLVSPHVQREPIPSDEKAALAPRRRPPCPWRDAGTGSRRDDAHRVGPGT